MKKLITYLLVIIPIITFSQVGIGTTTPDNSSLLDITDTSKGFLIPRMTLLQRNAIVAPAAGLLIYQTDNTTGFYYFDGVIWVSLTGSGWSLIGNSGTNPTINKVGTNDNQDFVFITNNTEKLRVNSSGNLGIGTSTPSSKLHLNSPSGYNYSQNFNSLSVGNLTTVTTNNPYFINNNTGCIAADGWRIETSSYAGCSGCTNNRAVIDYGASTCVQDATLVVKLGTINVDQINVSFDYGYDDFNATDQFIAFLYNETTSTIVSTLFSLSTSDANTNFNNNIIINPGNTYSLQFRYVGTDAGGATIDNINISYLGMLRIEDGFQGNGKVLISDANGKAVWGKPILGTGIDYDWTWDSGNTVSDPIYHVGSVFIGTGATTTTRNLQAWNGAATGTIIEVGSVEYLMDDANEIRISDMFTPLTNAAQDLGSTSLRWTSVFAVNGVINTSDANLKEEIQPIQYGLTEILELKPVSYKWKEEKINDFQIPNHEKQTKLGFIAQEVLEVIPEAIITKDWFVDGEHPENGLQEIEAKRLGISYSELIPVIIKAIQEQQIKIDALKEGNQKLKTLIKKLK